MHNSGVRIFWAIVLAFGLITLSAFSVTPNQARFPIQNGYLIGNLNGNRQYITNVAGITDTNGNPFVGGGSSFPDGSTIVTNTPNVFSTATNITHLSVTAATLTVSNGVPGTATNFTTPGFYSITNNDTNVATISTNFGASFGGNVAATTSFQLLNSVGFYYNAGHPDIYDPIGSIFNPLTFSAASVGVGDLAIKLGAVTATQQGFIGNGASVTNVQATNLAYSTFTNGLFGLQLYDGAGNIGLIGNTNCILDPATNIWNIVVTNPVCFTNFVISHLNSSASWMRIVMTVTNSAGAYPISFAGGWSPGSLSAGLTNGFILTNGVWTLQIYVTGTNWQNSNYCQVYLVGPNGGGSSGSGGSSVAFNPNEFATNAGVIVLQTNQTFNGVTLTGSTASTLLKSSASQVVTSIPNATGILSNDGSGNFNYVAPLQPDGKTIVVVGSTLLAATGNLYGYTNVVTNGYDGAGNLGGGPLFTNIVVAFGPGTNSVFIVTTNRGLCITNITGVSPNTSAYTVTILSSNDVTFGQTIFSLAWATNGTQGTSQNGWTNGWSIISALSATAFGAPTEFDVSGIGTNYQNNTWSWRIHPPGAGYTVSAGGLTAQLGAGVINLISSGEQSTISTASGNVSITGNQGFFMKALGANGLVSQSTHTFMGVSATATPSIIENDYPAITASGFLYSYHQHFPFGSPAAYTLGTGHGLYGADSLVSGQQITSNTVQTLMFSNSWPQLSAGVATGTNCFVTLDLWINGTGLDNKAQFMTTPVGHLGVFATNWPSVGSGIVSQANALFNTGDKGAPSAVTAFANSTGLAVYITQSVTNYVGLTYGGKLNVNYTF